MNLRPEAITENLRCYLTDEEKAMTSELLVRTIRDLADAERQIALIRADFKGRMETMDGNVRVLADKLAVGYEYRDVECRVLYNSPHSRRKTIVRADAPGEIVREEEMSDSECQENLPLENHVNQAPITDDSFKLDAETLPPPDRPNSIDGKAAAAND